MSNGAALVLAVLVLGAVAADQVWNGGAALVFLMQRFLDLLDWLAFWR
ncbi:hypothetical protein [Rhodosalinus sp. FB01]